MIQTPASASLESRRSRRVGIAAIAAGLVVLVAMALDTAVVRIGSDRDVRAQSFSAEAFGTAEFPRIQAEIETRAVDARTLFDAIAADKAAAIAQHGVPAGTGAVFAVRLTGIAGQGKSGIYDLVVEGLPPDLRVRVQTGPAINGTDLRDATGTIAFGQFTNQIEYQDAGSALNVAMKDSVLSGIDATALAGRMLEVTGAFRLANPNSWLITPVRLAVR